MAPPRSCWVPLDAVSFRRGKAAGRGVGGQFLTQSISPHPEIEDEEEKISRYRELLVHLPPVNRATVKALISHLYW